MAWTAQIIFGDGDIAGYNQIEVVYDASTQSAFKLKYGMKAGGQAPNVLYHASDSEPRVPVRAVDANAQLFLTISSRDDDWDVVFNNNNKISRLINGADSQAIRSAISGTAQAVKVKITPDGATNSTYYTVLSGFMDMSGAYFTSDALLNTQGREIVIVLECTLGEGDPFTLRNDLASSPHMIEDSNSDGLADGLTLLATPTVSLSTTFHLIGGQSQSVISTGTNEGVIASYSTSGSIGDKCAVKGYVNINTGGATVTVEIRNGGGTIISTVAIPDGAHAEHIGPDNDTWYEFRLSATATTTSGFQIYVYAAADAVTFFVDGLYLQFGTLIVPDGWCSSSALKNRYDPENTSAATRQQINYLDVWGLPGDLPAKTFIKNQYGSVTDSESLIVAKRIEGKIPNATMPFFFDSSEFTIGGTSWSTTVDASRIGGSYIETTSTLPTNETIKLIPPASDPYFGQSALRVFAVFKTDNINANINVRIKSGILNVLTIESVVPEAIDTWSIVDVGLMNLVGIIPNEDTASTANITIEIEGDGSAGDIFFDGIYFLPVDEFLLLPLTSASTAQYVLVNGNIPEVFVVPAVGVTQKQNVLGTMWDAMPRIENRYVFISRGDASGGNIEEHLITNTFAIELEVTPRTSHLLGTS